MKQFLLYSLRLRRVEYRIAEVPIYVIPILLTLSPHDRLFTPVFWQGLCIFMFMFAYGDLINCLTDRELDSIYKPHLTEAVEGLGVRGVLAQIAFSAAGALWLAWHLGQTTGRWLLFPGTVFGLLVGAAYSVEPLRLKGRGLGQLLFYWFGLFSGPMIFAAMMVTDVPPLRVVLVAFFYGMLQTGTILINTAEDYPEDKKMGVQTAVVRLGLEPAFQWAFRSVLLGWAGLLSSLALLAHSPAWSLKPLALAGLLCSLHLAWFKAQLRGQTLERQVELVKRLGRWAPIWISSMAVSTLVAAAATYLSVSN